MKIRYRFASLIALASVAACMAPTSSSDDVASSAEAVSATGITASVVVTNKTSQSYTATVTVTNSSKEPAYNWQVALNFNQSTLNQGTVGAEALTINGVSVFTPTQNGKMIAAGGSVTFTVNAAITGSNYTPTVVTVDGMANGTPGAGNPADGVDHIARAVATGALNLAEAYENNKLANKGDANYANYDGLIWAAQSYVLSGSKIAFDTNVPGYQYIPVQALAQLDAMQDSPAVASYLAAGLASCFADTNGSEVYNFKAGVLKGFTYPGPVSGTLTGNSPSTSTDTFTATGAAVNGAEQITVTMKSSTDMSFGILTASAFGVFGSPSAIMSKFKSGNATSCSPFNGPGGGTSNPLLIITLNASTIAARVQAAGAQCQNGCTSVLVADPDGYNTVGPYYNAIGLVGPQPNPFTYDSSQTAATPDHILQWATSTDLNGNIIYGSFTLGINHRGLITGYTWVQQ